MEADSPTPAWRKTGRPGDRPGRSRHDCGVDPAVNLPFSTLRENASIAILKRLGRAMLREERLRVREIQRDLAVSTAPETAISHLSGGNQQKIVLARWLLADPLVLFLDDPTRGIDVAAKEQIYGIIAELAAKGKGIILVSSELPELWRCCDRILVLQEGRQAGIVRTQESSQEEVMRLATGTVGSPVA